MMSYQMGIVIVLWLLLLIVKRVVMKQGWVESFVFLTIVGLYGVSVLTEQRILDDEIVEWMVLGGFAITLFLFNIYRLTHQDNNEEISKLKRDYKQVLTGYESMRKRYISTLELLRDGVSFRSDDGVMFCTDRLIEMLGLEGNELTQHAYEKFVHHDDLNNYEAVMKKLSKRNPVYEMSYRFKKEDNQTLWVKERGSLVFYEDRVMVIALVYPIDVKMFPRSEVEILNGLKVDGELLEHLQSLNRQKEPYHLVYIELRNIPDINRKFGRDIGDLMMGDFLNKLRFNIIKEERSLYRLTGIRFALVIRDERKYVILERALKHGGDLMNFEMRFGNVKQSVYPYFGIQKITVFDEPLDAIMQRTEKALDIALSESSQENYFVIS